MAQQASVTQSHKSVAIVSPEKLIGPIVEEKSEDE